MKNEHLLLLLVGFLGIAISLICNYLLLNFSQNLGIRNKNDVTIRWSNQSKPSLGGISFFVVFIFICIFSAIILTDVDLFKNRQVIGFLSAAALAFLMGLADDAFNTRPWLKFAVQIICGVILAFTSTRINVFDSYWLSIAFTVIWTIILMNSLNMLDNMDGITTSTVICILVSCVFVYFFYQGFVFTFTSASLIAMIACLIGFLKYNKPSSKIFMGDAGSQFIGLFVAYFSLITLWSAPVYSAHSFFIAIPVILTAFAPAAADTLTVTINRLKAGRSPMVGGKDHTTHHLVYSGKTEKQVWIIFSVIGLISVLLSTITACYIMPYYPRFSFLLLLYFIVIFYYLYKNTIKFKAPK